jgi:hypothetical protein
MNAVRFLILFLVFADAYASGQQTNTATATNIPTNATSTGTTNNAAPSSITIDGTTYEDVRWGRLTPSTVTVFHKTGIATIPLAKLPTELQKHFGYDSEKANAWQAAEQKAAAARANAERHQALLRQYATKELPYPLQVGAIGKLGQGLVVFNVLDTNRMLLHRFIPPQPYVRRSLPGWSLPFCLQGLPTSNYADGQNLELAWTGMVVKVTSTMTYDTAEGGQATIFVIEPYDGK